VAAGSYSSVAAVYDAASGSAAFILSGHKGGLTQVPPLCCPCVAYPLGKFWQSADLTRGYAYAAGIVVLTSACVRGFMPILLLLLNACSE